MSRVSSGCFPRFPPCIMSLVLPNVIDLSLKPFCSEFIYSLSLHCLVAFPPRYVILEIASPLQGVFMFGHWFQVLLQGVDRHHNRISPSSRSNKDKNHLERTKRRKITSFKKPSCIHWLKAEPSWELPLKEVEEYPCTADRVITRDKTFRCCINRFVICNQLITCKKKRV